MTPVVRSKHKALLFLIAREGEAGRSGGGHRIATEIRKHGWDVEVVDFFRFWTFEEIKQLLISRIDEDMKFIGFGSLFLAMARNRRTNSNLDKRKSSKLIDHLWFANICRN